jgi:hypothetical protein
MIMADGNMVRPTGLVKGVVVQVKNHLVEAVFSVLNKGIPGVKL